MISSIERTNDVLGEPNDVTVEESFDYAKANVPAVVPQTPMINDSFEDNLLL